VNPKSEKPLRLFVNPFMIWTDFALKTAEAMWSTAHVAAVRANTPKVGVIPTADAPAPKPQAAKPAEAKPAEAMLASAHTAALRSAKSARAPVKQASKAVRFKATRVKLRSKAKAKRRAKQH
jgi:hypothetical protein